MGKQNIQNEEVHWRKKDDLAALCFDFFLFLPWESAASFLDQWQS